MKKTIAVIALILLFFGCAGLPRETPSCKTYNVTLPHSGEKVSLCVVEENYSGPSRKLIAEIKENDRQIRVESSYGGSSGGTRGTDEIRYSDSNIGYVFGWHHSENAAGYSYETLVYNCTRGDCGFRILLNYTKVQPDPEYAPACCEYMVINQTICFTNGLYLRTLSKKHVANETEISREQGTGCPI